MAVASPKRTDPARTPAAAEPLRKTTPGALWPWVKRASWVELAIFAGLCFFWLAPGFDHETMIFGWDKDPDQHYQERYTSQEDALAGHQRAIEFVKRGEGPGQDGPSINP